MVSMLVRDASQRSGDPLESKKFLALFRLSQEKTPNPSLAQWILDPCQSLKIIALVVSTCSYR